MMNDIQNFNKLLLKNFKLNNVEIISNNINNFLKSIENEKKYNKIINTFEGFNKDKLGKSGGIVGKIDLEDIIKKYNKSIKKSKKINNRYSFIGKKNNQIIKIYKYKIDKIVTNNKKNCLKIFYPINEIINNVVINNLESYLSKKDYDLFNKNYKKYIIKAIDIGITKNQSYIITEQIGFKKDDYFYTTLYELFKQNYIPNIIKLIKNNNLDDIKLLIEFLRDLMKDYLKILIFLNKKIGFIHTDLKLENIFVRYKLNNNKKYNKLKKNFIIDYILLISDLDKSVIKPNKNIIIIPKLNSRLTIIFNNIIVKKLISDKLFYIRFASTKTKKKENFCHTFKSYHFDILTILLSINGTIMFNIYKDLNKKDIKSILKPINDLFQNKLILNNEQFDILFDIIYKNKKKIYKFVEFDRMINIFCNKLKKTKKKNITN